MTGPPSPASPIIAVGMPPVPSVTRNPWARSIAACSAAERTSWKLSSGISQTRSDRATKAGACSSTCRQIASLLCMFPRDVGILFREALFVLGLRPLSHDGGRAPCARLGSGLQRPADPNDQGGGMRPGGVPRISAITASSRSEIRRAPRWKLKYAQSQRRVTTRRLWKPTSR